MNSTISALLSLAALLFIAVQTSSSLSIAENAQGGSGWALDDEEQPSEYTSTLKLIKYEILLKLMNDLCDELDMCPPNEAASRQPTVFRRAGDNKEMRRAPHLFWRTALLDKVAGSRLKASN